jgi:hypothetical protein
MGWRWADEMAFQMVERLAVVMVEKMDLKKGMWMG